MLEIIRGRSWVLHHTVQETDGSVSDLRHLTTVLSQIRENTAVKNKKTGNFEYPLVATVTTELSGSKNEFLTQSLTRSQTALLKDGNYLIDVVGFDDEGNDEEILNPEPIRVLTRPTSTTAGDIDPGDPPVTIPNFSEIFEEALDD